MEHEREERGRRRTTTRPETTPQRDDALPLAAGNQAVVRMLARLKRGAADAARFQYESAPVMKAVAGGHVNLERPTKASGPIQPTGVPARGATAVPKGYHQTPVPDGAELVPPDTSTVKLS